MDGVFIGATWSRDMRNMMLLSFAGLSAAALVRARTPLFGNHGLWAALHVFLLVRGVSLLSRACGDGPALAFPALIRAAAPCRPRTSMRVSRIARSPVSPRVST